MANDSEKGKRRQRLRKGFSTGTAATAAARAALRLLVTGVASSYVSVRLPAGYFLPIPIARVEREGNRVLAAVIKDGGDDPDVTHNSEIMAVVSLARLPGPSENPREDSERASAPSLQELPGVCLRGGPGVGHVTKPGLPVEPGEPAINPVPRRMIVENLLEELLQRGIGEGCPAGEPFRPGTCSGSSVFLAFSPKGAIPADCRLRVNVEIVVPRGEEMARHTLNPRLGVVGGISILGTTGLVKPFSHQAYEETIQAGLSVARSAGCDAVVLSTGGKSEKFARGFLQDLPGECFVEIADFFAFAVRESVRLGFRRIVHSVFFGKAVKMAQGHPYTHAHRVAMDLEPLCRLAREKGYEEAFCRKLAQCNTARHALDVLREKPALDLVRAVALNAMKQSRKLADQDVDVRVLVFDYHGTLLANEGGR